MHFIVSLITTAIIISLENTSLNSSVSIWQPELKHGTIIFTVITISLVGWLPFIHRLIVHLSVNPQKPWASIVRRMITQFKHRGWPIPLLERTSLRPSYWDHPQFISHKQHQSIARFPFTEKKTLNRNEHLFFEYCIASAILIFNQICISVKPQDGSTIATNLFFTNGYRSTGKGWLVRGWCGSDNLT